jgi:hypothetical protein
MHFNKLLFSLSLFVCFLQILPAFAQDGNIETGKPELIQFSGVIVTGDSLKPVPYVNIIIKSSFRGTVSDFHGYFSFVAQELDTIIYSAIGFETSAYVIPDSLTTNRYSLIKIMITDTIELPETFIYPWPTREQFKQAFLNLIIPDDDLEKAKKNLALADMRERFRSTGMDGSMNYTNFMQEQTNKLYYAGQYPPTNLLNPIAWVKFIRAWKNGELKIEK